MNGKWKENLLPTLCGCEWNTNYTIEKRQTAWSLWRQTYPSFQQQQKWSVRLDMMKETRENCPLKKNNHK